MSMLIFDNEMVNFLLFAQRDTIIAALLLQGSESHLKDDGNYIKAELSETDVVSFISKQKIDKVEDVWQNGRTKIKVGRFIRKFSI